MTEILVDKHFDTEGTSSAIYAVYYSTEDQKIFFEFISGTIAGYSGVNADIYTALETLNENRLKGDTESSVGYYYNRFFRSTGYFAGVETADLEIITPEQVKLQEIAEANAAEIAAEQSLKSQDVFIEEVTDLPSVLRRFGVSFIYDGDKEMTFNVHATDENDAVVRFNKAVELLGWESIRIISLTRFFN